VIKKFPDAIYLDLERPSDLNKLTDPEAFFDQFSDRLICLDEIQRTPEIFPILRGIIDRNKKNSQFLILGSASMDLIRQSSESLAGRISYLEITPFTYKEAYFTDFRSHWLCGGYPRSLMADEETSIQWREDYIRTFLERDIPQLGFRIPAHTLSRFWRMLAHTHGQVLNSSKLADSMGVSSHTIRKYIDLLEQTFVLRVLPAFSANLKKRLIKSPKVYIRDSGILHSLLGIETTEDLFANPVYGASYEGLVIENILTQLSRWQASYYKTSNGAEIDLILTKGIQTIAVEIKSSTSPRLSKSFWNAIEYLSPDQTTIIAPVKEEYPIAEKVMVKPLHLFIEEMASS
ncbi:MAG: ATP-binding protein, partial [Desulfobacteraceae bacterium]|nr:ATP-binding protein [Desulfobacteraceae bacterium]